MLAGIATGMIASIALEDDKALPVGHTLRLSVARFTSPAPHTFWKEILFRRDFVGFHLRFILLGLLISSATVQFFSTILLTDLGGERVIGFPSHDNNGTGFSWEPHGKYGPYDSDNALLQPRADFMGHNVPFQS